MDAIDVAPESYCEFCIEFEDVDRSQFRHIFPTEVLATRTIVESQHFVVFVALGPLVEGYLLIAPKTHIVSYARVPVDWYSELMELKLEVSRILGSVYAKPIFFEHGSASPSRKGGASIEHAHMHAVPTRIDLVPLISEHFQGQRLHSLPDLRKLVGRDVPYLFCENTQEEMFVFPTPTRIPSQFMRRLLARAVGIPDEWDWAAYPRKRAMVETMQQLSFAVSAGD